MSEFLEAMMLICFGLSWPINLVKNVRARSAKAMSLQFILLIIFGYVAGITAKLINHRINYVLAVYFFNLAIVSCNLVVYFYNRRLDRTGTAMVPANPAVEAATEKMEEPEISLTQSCAQVHEENMFHQMNAVAKKGGVVFFGSNRFAELPVAELIQSFHMDETVYNRSIANAAIDEIAPMVDSCVTELNPDKVFVNLGDADLEDPALDPDEFITKYECLLRTIAGRTKAKIYVVSLLSVTATAREINTRLNTLALENGCEYIDVTNAIMFDRPDLRMFDLMKSYVRTHPIDFSEAMTATSI